MNFIPAGGPMTAMIAPVTGLELDAALGQFRAAWGVSSAATIQHKPLPFRQEFLRNNHNPSLTHFLSQSYALIQHHHH